MPSTIKLHRVLRTTPDKLYRAFTTPEAVAKWLAPHGFTCTVHRMEAKVGGDFRISFANFSTGNSHAFGGIYLELEPGERLRYTDEFDNPDLPGRMTTTINMRAVACGTDLCIEQTGIPDAIPSEACYLGWQESLALLALLVEADIPD